MRLFFGLSLPEEIRAATGECAARAAASIPGRYAPAENHHITLAFLGDVPQARLDGAARVLSGCVKEVAAPVITLGSLSHFGRAQNGILVIRVHSEPALDDLHVQLVGALRDAGLPADPGPFSPHITLARHAVIPEQLPQMMPLRFTATHAHVFLSARDAQNVLRYTPIYTVSFLD